ncbi:MAG TPA: electron transfer flavoprotein subunit alpha/FixB family protein [Dehalococcoidia bacterium]|nr:electron transfer flavoprotein subunit alpha/FixB family protein [Dehalococcoidia bacterium]
MADNKGVLILAEVADGNLAAIATELLGAGRKLADDLGEELSALLVGSEVSGLAQEAIAFGADKVYVVEAPELKDYRTDSYIAVVEKAAKEVAPKVLLMGQNSIGRDLAPRLAFRLDAAVSTDCIELAIDADSKQLLMTKPVYGGNARAIYITDTIPQMATLRVKAGEPLARDDSRKGEVVSIDAGLDESAVRTKVIDTVLEEIEGIKLEDANIIVSGGRGMGGPEGFKDLEGLARVLKAAVGASRPPCDNGWVPDTMQVGLTGKIVSPDLYIAVAISGSSQHIAGCGGSKTIVAINRDPEANIFKEAAYGVVGDWKKVIPAFMEKAKELMA